MGPPLAEGMAMNDVINGGSGRSNLVDRAKNILLKPAEEWPKIEAEPDTVQDILLRYVLPLAAIGPIASFIGTQLLGGGDIGPFRRSLISSLSSAVVAYVLAVLALIVLSLIADALAPKFGGRSDRLAAFKLVAYSYTAAMLAGVFGLIPQLAFLKLLGLYSFYLFYTGAAPMVKVPQDKAVAYTALTVVSAILLYIVVSALTGALVSTFVPGPTYISNLGADSGAVQAGLGLI